MSDKTYHEGRERERLAERIARVRARTNDSPATLARLAVLAEEARERTEAALQALTLERDGALAELHRERVNLGIACKLMTPIQWQNYCVLSGARVEGGGA